MTSLKNPIQNTFQNLKKKFKTASDLESNSTIPIEEILERSNFDFDLDGLKELCEDILIEYEKHSLHNRFKSKVAETKRPLITIIMMNTKFIEKLEQELQISLPTEYKKFLNNGIIEVEETIFNIGKVCHDTYYENKDNANENVYDYVAVDTFYGDLENSVNDLFKNNVYDFSRSRIPDDFITIASSMTGDQICLGVKGEYTGKVYMWEMEFEADENTPQPYYENMTLITNTFQEFLDGLFLDI